MQLAALTCCKLSHACLSHVVDFHKKDAWMLRRDIVKIKLTVFIFATPPSLTTSPSSSFRSIQHPHGLPDLLPESQGKVRLGNIFNELVGLLMSSPPSVRWIVQHPASSLFWHLPCVWPCHAFVLAKSLTSRLVPGEVLQNSPCGGVIIWGLVLDAAVLRASESLGTFGGHVYSAESASFVLPRNCPAFSMFLGPSPVEALGPSPATGISSQIIEALTHATPYSMVSMTSTDVASVDKCVSLVVPLDDVPCSSKVFSINRGNEVEGNVTYRIGIYHSPIDFLALASTLTHPFVLCSGLSSCALQAIKRYLACAPPRNH